jgi:hypothetical protein
MKRDLVFLNEERDIVPARDAIWAVETFRDDNGKVVRESWGKIKSVAARPKQPVVPTSPQPPPPTAASNSASRSDISVYLISLALMAAAVVGARFGLPDILTGALTGAGLALGLYYSFSR